MKTIITSNNVQVAQWFMEGHASRRTGFNSPNARHQLYPRAQGSIKYVIKTAWCEMIEVSYRKRESKSGSGVVCVMLKKSHIQPTTLGEILFSRRTVQVPSEAA